MRRKVSKSQELIEASANIAVEEKIVKCLPARLKPWTSLFIDSRRASMSAEFVVYRRGGVAEPL
jgi:hypothetical protein